LKRVSIEFSLKSLEITNPNLEAFWIATDAVTPTKTLELWNWQYQTFYPSPSAQTLGSKESLKTISSEQNLLSEVDHNSNIV